MTSNATAKVVRSMEQLDDAVIAMAIEKGLLKPEQLKAAEVTMGRGRMYLREACPWFRPMMLKLVPRWSMTVPSIAVTKGAILVVNPLFIAGLNDEEMAYLLAHELMHMFTHTSDRCGDRDPGEWNCASDRAINCILEDIPALKMPSGDRKGLLPSDIKMPNYLVADEYYRAPKPEDESGGDGDDEEGESKPGKGKPKAKPGQGACGGCAGNPVDGEPDDAGDPDARGEAELDRSARNMAEAIQDAETKQRGSVPAGLVRIAAGMLAPPKVDWRKMLAAEIRSAIQWAAGHTNHRYDAPSRRQSGVGWGAGRPILPRLRQPIPEVACVIDTSGSMSQNDVGAAVRETMGVAKSCCAPITLCVCDAAVHGMKPVTTLKEVLGLLAGGGGSDFRPAFRELEKRKPRPSVLVFLTDGEIGVPDHAPNWARVIWVSIGKSAKAPAAWGRHVHVDD